MNWPVGSRGSWFCPRALSVASVLLLAIMTPEVAADGPPLARLLPANDLVTYLEHDGLAAHSTAWKATAAYDILGRTSCGAMLSDVTRQVIDNLFKEAPQRRFKGSEILAIEQHLVDQGFALASYAEEGCTSTVYVVKAAGKPGDRTIELVQRYVFTPDAPAPLPAPSVVRGRRVFTFGAQEPALAPRYNAIGFSGLLPRPAKSVTTWFEGNDLIVVDGPNSDAVFPSTVGEDPKNDHHAARHKARVAAVLDSIEGKRASIATHPGFVAAAAQGRDVAGFEPGGLFFDEMSKAGSELRVPVDRGEDQG